MKPKPTRRPSSDPPAGDLSALLYSPAPSATTDMTMRPSIITQTARSRDPERALDPTGTESNNPGAEADLKTDER